MRIATGFGLFRLVNDVAAENARYSTFYLVLVTALLGYPDTALQEEP
jgi:hypothetical protein